MNACNTHSACGRWIIVATTVASGVNNAIARIAALLAIAVLGALAVSIFQHDLISHLQQTITTPEQQQLIISRAQRMGGIIIPPQLPQETQQIFQGAHFSLLHATVSLA